MHIIRFPRAGSLIVNTTIVFTIEANTQIIKKTIYNH